MNFVWYCRITCTTGKLLAADLECEHGNNPPRERISTLIRWGNADGIHYNPVQVLNKKDAMVAAIDKHRATGIFRENRIPVPTQTTTVPCVGRSNFHTQGQNFWLCWEESQVRTARREGAEYFIKYIPIKQEWRVHVVDGEVVFVQRKYEQDRVSTSFMGIQGFRDNWHTQALAPETAGSDVCDVGLKAVEALGLDFGGADIVVSLEDNHPYILEVNTGPSLPTPETRRPYVRFIKSRIRAVR